MRYYVKERWSEGKRLVNLSLVKAVKQFCMACQNHSSKQVRECESKSCQLYYYRNGWTVEPAHHQTLRKDVTLYCYGCSKGYTEECDSLCLLRPWKRSVVDRSHEVKKGGDK